MKIAVLNVGNAAATVLGDDDDTPRVLLDGGRQGNLSDLEWYLTNRSPSQRTSPNVHHLNALVASHFDVDHWGGLASLGQAHAHKGRNAPLSIFYPRMPEAAVQVPAAMFYLRYLTGELPMPFTPESLAASWRSGRAVRPSSLRRGDLVTLANAEFRVLWPPRTLPPKRAKSLTTALNQVRTAARADPYFGPLYDQLHESPFGEGGEAAHELGTELAQSDGSEPSHLERPADVDDGGSHFDGLPGELVKAGETIHRWNNDLSLVLVATDDTFLAMGDVTSQWAVTGALESAPTHVTWMLAPHHGTHADQNLPSADECFMQTGHSHSERTGGHIIAHASAAHLCTHTTAKQGNTVRTVPPCAKAGCNHPATGGFFRR